MEIRCSFRLAVRTVITVFIAGMVIGVSGVADLPSGQVPIERGRIMGGDRTSAPPER